MDAPSDNSSFIPARLGIIAEEEHGVLRMRLHPKDPVLSHGVLRSSVVSLMIDLAAAFALDDRPDVLSLTTDMSVRTRPRSAPDSVVTRCTILKQGGRSATATVDLIGSEGDPVATGAIGFSRIPRRAGDPQRSPRTFEGVLAQFDGSGVLTRPLREAVGLTVVEPRAGLVEMPVTSAVRNTVGTLQGAMVALVAELAVEELIGATFDVPAAVLDLDLRYLAQTGDGPVHTRCTLLGKQPDAAVRVEIGDRSSNRMIALAYARAAVVGTG